MEIEEEVIKLIRQRREIGRKEYGKTMEREDPVDWLDEARKELADGTVYLTKARRVLRAVVNNALLKAKRLEEEAASAPTHQANARMLGQADGLQSLALEIIKTGLVTKEKD